MRAEEAKVEEFLPRRPRLATLYILYDEIGHVTCGCGMEWLSGKRQEVGKSNQASGG